VQLLTELELTHITVVGYDLIHSNIEALKEYKNFYLINQNPSLQGYYAIQKLYEYLLVGKTNNEKKYLPLDVICLENMDNYIHIQNRDGETALI